MNVVCYTVTLTVKNVINFYYLNVCNSDSCPKASATSANRMLPASEDMFGHVVIIGVDLILYSFVRQVVR
jgi:hypothetical protein